MENEKVEKWKKRNRAQSKKNVTMGNGKMEFCVMRKTTGKITKWTKTDCCSFSSCFFFVVSLLLLFRYFDVFTFDGKLENAHFVYCSYVFKTVVLTF